MDVTETTFDAEVIERSREVPVIVDFWAAWCGPCRQLTPILEQAVERRDGAVVLAKVDIDANPNLAQQHRVMSIPLVKGFRDGSAVAEFVGLQPPPAIEAFIDRLVPSEVNRLVSEGDEASLREAIALDPGHVGARVALARLLLGEGRHDEVPEVLEPVAFDQGAAALLSRVRLAAVDQPDVQAGLAALDRGQTEQGLGHLVDAVRLADPELREDLRQALLGVFAELGEHHPLSVRFRRRLAQALYSELELLPAGQAGDAGALRGPGRSRILAPGGDPQPGPGAALAPLPRRARPPAAGRPRARRRHGHRRRRGRAGRAVRLPRHRRSTRARPCSPRRAVSSPSGASRTGWSSCAARPRRCPSPTPASTASR